MIVVERTALWDSVVVVTDNRDKTDAARVNSFAGVRKISFLHDIAHDLID